MLPFQFDVYLVTNSSGNRHAKHPLTTSGRCWFCFFHTFFSLAQLCKKPMFFMFFKRKTSEGQPAWPFITNVLGKRLAPGASFDSKTCPIAKVTQTTDTPPSGNESDGLFFKFIGNTKSKRKKVRKPCGRTAQSSTGLHYQAHKKHRTEIVRGYLAPHFWK